jgi:hypothetical protein
MPNDLSFKLGLVTPLFCVLIARAFRRRAADIATGGCAGAVGPARYGVPVP